MAQESFDSLTPARGRQLAQDKADSTAEIKSEIERTRIEMSETLGEIQERLRPDHLIQQAKETVTDGVTDAVTGKVRNIMNSASETATRVADQTRYAGRSVADYACAHPAQMALLAGGLTWWLLRGRGRSDDWTGASEGHRLDTDYDTEYAYGEDRSLRDKAGEYVSSARETVSEYASSAKETVGEYADAARSTARRASERVRGAAGTASVRARDTWQRTSTTVDDWVHENPMAAGALAIAVGAAVGLSVRSTDFEDRTLGERRDQAMERARAKARELQATVTDKVEKAMDVAGIPGSKSAAETSGVGVSGTSTSSTTSSTIGRV